MTMPTPFQAGPRLIDGTDLNKALAYPAEAYTSGVVAKAAGTVANSTPITESITQVDTVASANDGLLLPAAVPGKIFTIIVNSANGPKVFAAGGSTINGTAGATGLQQTANTVATYVCAKAGAWFRQLSA